MPFLAKAEGIDAKGEPFEIESTLDNFSASGLYMRLARDVKAGTELRVLIHLPTAATDNPGAWQIATDGVVVRSDALPEGTCGVAVGFSEHRFI